MTDVEKQLMQRSIEEGYDTFISHVAEGRKMSKAQVDSIGQGRVWTGENAKQIGLVDDFGGLKEAISMAAEIEGLDEYRTVSLPTLPDPFEELFKVGTDNIRARFIKNELGDNYRYYEYLKKMAGFNGIYARLPYDISIY
jgi:protease-4